MATMIRMSWARVASVEETLVLWAASLREIKQRIRPLFTQERVVTNAGLFLEGLLGDEQRKTGWMRAEAAGDPGPWRQQAILGRGDWDADALRDIVRNYVVEHLADDDAVLVIDRSVFSNRAKRHAEWRGNTLVLHGRLRTARSASSLPTFRVMVMRSSIVRCIFRRNGLTIRIVWKLHTCLPTLALQPNQSLRREWLHAP
jgi:hypothetical protein